MSYTRGISRNIPNIITLLNLGCGSLAIYYIFQQDWMMVCLLVGISALADFADGLVARWLNVASPIGKELDSLADMVSFGLLPGLVIFQLLLNATGKDILSALPALLITLFAALRLARFNTMENTSGDFIGLSTPACTALVIGLVLIKEENSPAVLADLFSEPLALYLLSALCAMLMVSNISMFSLKFKNMSWKNNELRFIFIIGFFGLLIINKWAALFTTFSVYIIVSAIQNWFFKKQ